MAEYSDGSMVVDTEIDTEGFLKDSDKLKKAIASLTKQVDSIGQQMKTAIARNNTAAMEVLNRKFTETQSQAEALRKKMEGFSRTKILSDDYARTTAEIKKTEAELSKLMERQEKMRVLGEQSIEAQKEQLRQKAEAEMQAMDGWEKMAPWSKEMIRAEYMKDLEKEFAKLGKVENTAAFRSVQYDVDKLREKLAQLNAEKEKLETNDQAFKMGTDTQEYEQLNQQMAQTEQHMEQVEQTKERAFSAPSASGLLGFLAGVARSALNAAANLARIAGNGALSYLRKLASGAKNAAIQLMKLAGRAISSGIQRIGTMASSAGKALLGLGKNAKHSSGGLNVGLKALLRYGLGIRSVFALINKLRRAVADAFKNMAKKVPEVNQSLSRLASSLDRMKNSLATAFQPILTAVAPYLAQFMDMISNALTKVGEFFAALTGQKYVYKATKAQIDYAESLDKTSKSAKEAKNQLADFDNLHILSDSSSNDSSNSNTETPTSSFEKVPIESQISDFARRIKDAFNNGDFYEIGKILAETVYGWFSSIDWVKVGTIIGKGIMALVDIILGFAENFPWAEVGRRLAMGLNALFDNIDPVRIAKALIAVMNGALDALLAFIETFKWEKYGKKLAAGIRQFIKDLPVEKLGEVLRKGIVGILKFIRPALGDEEIWKLAGQKLGDLLNELFKGKPGEDNIWTELEGAIVDLAEGVVTALSNFVATFKWGDNGKVFHDAVFRLVDDFPLNELGGALMDLLKGSLEFMNETFGDQTLFDNLGRKLADFMNTVFSKEETWEEIGKTANNMLKDVLTFTHGFLEEFEPDTAAQSIKTALGEIDWFGIASETWEAIKLAFSKTGSFLDALFSEEISDEMKSKADGSAYWQSAVDNANAFNGQSLGAKIGSRISQAIATIDWKQFGSDLSKGATNLLNNFADALNKLTQKGDNGRSPIEDAIVSFIEGIDKDALADSIKNALRAVADVIVQTFGTVLNEAFDALFSSRPLTVDDMQSDPTMVHSWDSKGAKLADALADGYINESKKREGDVKGAMTATFMDQYENAVEGSNGFDIGSPSKRTEKLGGYVVEGFTGGLESQESEAQRRTKTLFDGLFETIVATAVAMHTFQTIILTALTNLEQHFPTRMNTYKTQFETGWNTINSVVSTSMTTLQSTILTALTNLEKHFPTRLSTYNKQFETGWKNINTTTGTGWETIQRTITQVTDNLSRDIPNRFQNMGNVIRNQDWYSVGNGIIQGIANGINSGWNWLHNLVWNLAQSLLNAAKAALGIHSPSKVFRDEVGAMLGLGVAEGMEDSEPAILNAVSSVADAMAAEMNKADVTANLGVKRGGITDDLDSVLSTFSDKVSDSFSNLMNRLEAIAESVTFRLPDVATGGVVPYRVSAQSGDFSKAISDVLTASTDEQTSAIIQGFNNQTVAIVRALEQYCTTQINLDKKSLTDAIIEEINRRTRMTNKSPLLL